MATHRKSRIIATLVLVVALVGVVVGVSIVKARHTSNPTDDRTALQQVLAAMPASGRPTVDMARQAFSLSFEQLPGVEVPAGSRDDITDGTMALSMMVDHWPELRDTERATVLSWLQPPPASEASTENGLGAGAGPLFRVVGPARSTAVDGPTTAVFEQVEAGLTAFRGQMDRLTGRTLPGKVQLYYNLTERTIKARPAQAYTLAHSADQIPGDYPTGSEFAPLLGATGPYAGCFIWLNPSGWHQQGADLDFVLAHELFHCYEGYASPSLAASYASPLWVLEGAADWAAAQLAPGAAYPVSHWHAYLLAPGTPLDQQSYAAIGFWTRLDETTFNDPWTTSLAVLGQPSASALRATGALDDAFLDNWASSYFRQSWYATRWDIHGKTVTAEHVDPEEVAVGNDELRNLDTPPSTSRLIGNGVFYATVDADIVVVIGAGHVTMHNNAEDAARFMQRVYCARDAGCVCPPGSANTDDPPPPLGGHVIAFGLSGGVSDSSVSLQGVSLADWCGEADPPVSRIGEAGVGGGSPAGSDADLCHQIVEREGIDGLMNNPSMTPQDIQDCVAEILSSGGFGP